jgi:hypothetical protein
MKALKLHPKKTLLILAILGVLLVVIIFIGLTSSRAEMSRRDDLTWSQKQAIAEDFERIHDLEYYGALINEFYKKTGAYPLQGEKLYSNYIYIANEEQIQNFTAEPDPSFYETSVSKFIAELETGLGRDIEVRYDPDDRKTYFPNYYTYMINGGTYYFEINLSYQYPFAKYLNLGRYRKFSRMEITNDEKADTKGTGNWYYEELIKDPEFMDATSSTAAVSQREKDKYVGTK